MRCFNKKRKKSDFVKQIKGLNKRTKSSYLTTWEINLCTLIMEKEEWKYLLINGKYKTVEVQNPNFDKGVLNSIKDLRPFNKKGEDEKPIILTVQDAQNLKREIYSSFFRKPFKNFLTLTGAGASMDVGGPSMKTLWDIADKKHQVIDPLEIDPDENGFEIICTNF